MKSLCGGLSAAIEEQRRLVAQHAPEDVPAFERVIKVLPALRDELGLGQFLNALAVDHKPRVLYRFVVASASQVAVLGPQVVLKIYGDRPRGEGPLQQSWRARGLNVPRLACGEEGECSWLVIEHLDLRPAKSPSVNQLDFADHLAEMAREMHRPVGALALMLRSLGEVMMPRWMESVSTLRQAGHDIPASWKNKAIAGYARGVAVPLHGDLAPANMGWISGGRLVVFDASALMGSSCFDAARWSARVGPEGAGPEALLERWMSVEGLPSGQEPGDMLAAECVLEAGSRETVLSRTVQKNLRTSPRTAATGVSELLAVASRQWS